MQTTESSQSPSAAPPGVALVPSPGSISLVPWQSTGGMISLAAVIIGGGLVLLARFKQRRANLARAARRDPLVHPDHPKHSDHLVSRAVSKQSATTMSAEVDAARAAASELRQLTDELASILDIKSQHLESLIARADTQLARLEKAAQRAQPAISSHEATSFAEAKPRPASIAPSSSHAEVHRLADQGLTPVEIARQIGKPTGTVELILSLRRAAAR